MREIDVQIFAMAKAIFDNKLKYETGGLFTKFYLLEEEQQKHFNKGHVKELEPGKYEKKILAICDDTYAEIIRGVLKELFEVYEKSFRQDARQFWAAAKKAMLDICKDKKRMESFFLPYIKHLHFGHFESMNYLHLDWEMVINHSITEYLRKSLFTDLSTPKERRELLIPDVGVILGMGLVKDLSPEKMNAYALLEKVIVSAAKKSSEGMATVDKIDGLITVAAEKRGNIVERALAKSPVFVADVSSEAPAAYSAAGFRKAMGADIIVICHKDKWNEKAFAILQWKVLLYSSLEELEKLLAVKLYDIFEKHEFSGTPDIIL